MTPLQCRMARAALRWTVRELAQKAGVMPNTVTNLENGKITTTATVSAIEEAILASGLIIFEGKVLVIPSEKLLASATKEKKTDYSIDSLPPNLGLME